MGMQDLVELLLSILIASMATMSGRCKSVIMRSGRSRNAFFIP